MALCSFHCQYSLQIRVFFLLILGSAILAQLLEAFFCECITVRVFYGKDEGFSHFIYAMRQAIEVF